MLSPANLFRLLNELVFILLGALLLWVARTGRYFFDRRAPLWIALGTFLIYWGLRASWRGERRPPPPARRERAITVVRGSSLALVGAMMLGIAWLPSGWVGPLLGVAGALLILRGMVSAVLVVRFS
jgi:hypothetical protein